MSCHVVSCHVVSFRIGQLSLPSFWGQ